VNGLKFFIYLLKHIPRKKSSFFYCYCWIRDPWWRKVWIRKNLSSFYQCCGSGILFRIPDLTFFHPGSEFFHPGSRIRFCKTFLPKKLSPSSENKGLKTGTWEPGYEIRDPGSEKQDPTYGNNLFWFSDPGVKKASNSGSATIISCRSITGYFLRNQVRTQILIDLE
jgi:hypothetical protein